MRGRASRRPMLPKQTQLQNNTLAIHVPTPMLSVLSQGCIPFSEAPELEWTLEDEGKGEAVAGAKGEAATGAGGGTMAGLILSNTAVPVIPTAADRRSPVFDRSIRYHSTGFARARVSET